MIKLVCGVVNSVGVEHVHFTVAVSLGVPLLPIT
jgi:hypothetical protein